MAKVISRLHEQQRKDRAEAKRRERAQRRLAKRAGALSGGSGHSGTADAPERARGATWEQQSATRAGSLHD